MRQIACFQLSCKTFAARISPMPTPKIRLEIVTRVLADIAILNSSLLMSLLINSLIWNTERVSLVIFWWRSACLLTVGGPLFFHAMGFYTKGRSYSGRYKAVIVLEAAILLFAGLGFVLYVVGWQPLFPRSAFLLSWVMCSLLLIAVRLWAKLWTYVVIREVPPTRFIVTGRVPGVLVIGGAGYIGSAVIPPLLTRGYRVRILDCLLFGKEPILPLLKHSDVEVCSGDFRNVDTVVSAMRDMQSVIHLGGLVGDPACAVDEELTIQINLIATRMIAQVAKGNAISRFVFASSCSVYGAGDQMLNEKSQLNPVSLYARSKIASESVLLGMRDSSFEPVILRFGTIYGLSGRTRFDLVVNLMAAKAVLEGVIAVRGRHQWRPFLHVEDAAHAVVLALASRPESVRSVCFNVGSNEQNRTIGQVGELIQSMVPGSVICYSEEGTDPRNYRVEFQRIREELGFQPNWSLPAGVQQVLTAIMSGKIKDYEDPKYSNVKVISAPVTRASLPVVEDWVPKVLPHASPVAVGVKATSIQRTVAMGGQ